MVYDGAFIAEAFPALFPRSETNKYSELVGERKRDNLVKFGGMEI